MFDETTDDEIRRAEAISKAVECADRIILDSSNHSLEEIDYLTAAVAKAFAEKLYGRIATHLLREDLQKRAAGA